MCRHPMPHLLRRCTTAKHATQLHAFLVKSALDQHHGPLARLVHLCAVSFSASLLDHACSIFDHSSSIPPLFAWNALFRGYTINCLSPSSSMSSKSLKCVFLFVQFKRSGILPDNFTYPFVLKACSSSFMLFEGKQIHSDIFKKGFGRDLHVLNTLIAFYGACRSIADACRVFAEMPDRDVVSWSSIMAAYVHNGLYTESLLAFREMNIASVIPNSVTLVSLISACSCLKSLRSVKCVHGYIVVNEIRLDAALGTALLDMYATCGDIDNAFLVFSDIRVKNLASWTAMISGFANHGRSPEVVSLFKQMELENIEPDSTAFTSILSACSHLGFVEEGQRLFEKMRRVYRIKPTMEHYGCIVDMFGRAGMLEEAYVFIKKMPVKPNAVVLRSFLGACRSRGQFVGADEGLMELLLQVDPHLGANYVLAANVSALSGQWNNTAELWKVMNDKGLKKTAGSSLVAL